MRPCQPLKNFESRFENLPNRDMSILVDSVPMETSGDCHEAVSVRSVMETLEERSNSVSDDKSKTIKFFENTL